MIFSTSCPYTVEYSANDYSESVKLWCKDRGIFIVLVSNKLLITGDWQFRWIMPDNEYFSLFALTWDIDEIE